MTKAIEIANSAILNHIKAKDAAANLNCSKSSKIKKAKSLIRSIHADFVDNLMDMASVIVRDVSNSDVRFKADGPRKTSILISLYGYRVTVGVLDVEITSIAYNNKSAADSPDVDVSEKLDTLVTNVVNNTDVFVNPKSWVDTLCISNAACLGICLSSVVSCIEVEIASSVRRHDATLRSLTTESDIREYLTKLSKPERASLWSFLNFSFALEPNVNRPAVYYVACLNMAKLEQEKPE